MSHQISEFELARFARGVSSALENRRIVAHLLAGCATCGPRIGSLLTRPVAPSAYDPVFSRLERRASPAASVRPDRERRVARWA